MRILKRQFACVVAVGLMGGGISSAFAQGAPTNQPAPSNAPTPTTAPAEAEEMCDPPNACADQSGSAQAQGQAQVTEPQPVEPAPAPMPTTYTSPQPQPQYSSETVSGTWVDRVGLGFAIGGGVDDFSGETMRGQTSVGGSWTARVTFGTRSYVALEGSYIGSAQSIDSFGLDNDAILVGNGAQGALRINVTRFFPAQPFVYGGIAWRHYNITNNSINTSDVANEDDVAEFPLGVGFSGYVGGFMADVRGEYRIATAEDLAPSVNENRTATLDRWGVTGNLGFSY